MEVNKVFRYLSGSGKQYPSIAQKTRKSCQDLSRTISFWIWLENFPSPFIICRLIALKTAFITPSSFSQQITTRSIWTAVPAMALPLHSGQMYRYLSMKTCLCRLARKRLISLLWLTCPHFCENDQVLFLGSGDFLVSGNKKSRGMMKEGQSVPLYRPFA